MTWTSAVGRSCKWLLYKIVHGLALTRISPNALAHNAASDRRCRRDQAFRDIGLLAGHQPVLDLLVLLRVEDQNRRAEPGAVARNVGQVDERKLSHAALELAQARVDELLALLGHVILGVL